MEREPNATTPHVILCFSTLHYNIRFLFEFCLLMRLVTFYCVTLGRVNGNCCLAKCFSLCVCVCVCVYSVYTFESDGSLNNNDSGGGGGGLYFVLYSLFLSPIMHFHQFFASTAIACRLAVGVYAITSYYLV